MYDSFIYFSALFNNQKDSLYLDLFFFLIEVGDRAWVVRLYGEIIPEL